jgi:hypothetical protein
MLMLVSLRSTQPTRLIGNKRSDLQSQYRNPKPASFIQKRLSEGSNMTSFKAVNALESELESARVGRSSMPEFLRLLSESDVVVPSAGEVMPDGSGFQPLLFDKEGTQMVACFTAKERIGRYADIASYCLTINGGEFLQRIPPSYGLVVNPGQSVGFDITPEGLGKIITELNLG